MFSVVDCLPLKLVLLLASPYLAGVNGEEAIKIGHRVFERDHFCGTIDILGESATSVEMCETYVNMFLHLINAVLANRLPVSNEREQFTISMKPSMFSPCVPADGSTNRRQFDEALNRMARVVDYAFRHKIRVTLEAEDEQWADFQLQSYFSLINAGYNNLGTVLQSRLFRTAKDIERFDKRMRVRLVIGAYMEPAAIAYTDKAKMKELLVQYAGQLLSKGVYVELASHDAHCIESFFREIVISQKVQADRFETQFLLGVPRVKLERALLNGDFFRNLIGDWDPAAKEHLRILSESGVIVRMYLPFGQDNMAGPYCKRRLKRNPNMLVYGIKNLLGIES